MLSSVRITFTHVFLCSCGITLVSELSVNCTRLLSIFERDIINSKIEALFRFALDVMYEQKIEIQITCHEVVYLYSQRFPLCRDCAFTKKVKRDLVTSANALVGQILTLPRVITRPHCCCKKLKLLIERQSIFEVSRQFFAFHARINLLPIKLKLKLKRPTTEGDFYSPLFFFCSRRRNT